MCLFQFTKYTQEGSSLNEGERKLFPVLEDQGCLLVAHTRHMEQITRRMESDLPVQNKETQKRKPQFTPFKNPFLLFGRAPPRSNELPPKPQHQGLGALNMYKPAI